MVFRVLDCEVACRQHVRTWTSIPRAHYFSILRPGRRSDLLVGDNHSVRLVNAEQQAGYPVDTKPLALKDAVSEWKKANDCEKDTASCPRPVIIAAAGGASRAAFFEATVLGYLLESSQSSSAGLDPAKVRNRLFAISGVSGGSVGAVMIAAAFADANNGVQPCHPISAPLWWKDKVTSWRDCLEALTSGDFLSADVLGFAFNDMLPFPFFRDRAAVLEDSWRDHYERMIQPKSSPKANAMVSTCPSIHCVRPPLTGYRCWLSTVRRRRLAAASLRRFYRRPTTCLPSHARPSMMTAHADLRPG